MELQSSLLIKKLHEAVRLMKEKHENTIIMQNMIKNSYSGLFSMINILSYKYYKKKRKNELAVKLS